MFTSRPHCLGLVAIVPLLAVSAAAQYTELPTTVAPGRFLLEVDALSLVVDRQGSEKFTGLLAGFALVTTGLSSEWDIQLGAELFVSQRYESGEFTERRSGIGDVLVRTKWRFYEDEMVSIAVLPFVKIPTNRGGVGNDSVEGGIIVPWETYLIGGLTLNSMVEVDFVRNAADDGYDALWYASTAINREITRRLTIYAELDATKTSGGGAWQSTLGVGAYLTVSELLSWDFVLYRGLSRNSPDWNPIVRVNVGF
jgi:hypothetical protein